MRIKLFDVVGVLSVIAMVVSLLYLVRRFETGFGELQLEITQEELEAGFREGYEYHSLYLGAKKVGTLRTERHYAGEGYLIITEMELVVASGFGKGSTSSRLVAELDEAFRLDRFELRLDSGLLDLDLEGQWDEDAMVVSGLPGAGERRFEMPEAPFILPSLRPVLMRKKLKEGDRMTMTYYDPMTQAPVETDIRYLGREELELMGERVEAYHFEEVALGHRAQVWVNALGEVLIEELPMGFRAVREPEAEARFGLREVQSATSDRISFAPITELGRGRWSRGQLRLRNNRVFGARGGQELESDQYGIDRIQVEAREEMPLRQLNEARQLEEMQASMAKTAAIDFESAAVQDFVAPFLGQRPISQQISDVATALAQQIELEPEARLDRASLVLAAKRADAKGMALTLTAALRALGHPAHPVFGLVYNGEVLVFHHWVEVYVGTWIGLDPSLQQIPVDGGYFVLGSGSEVDELLAREALGELEVLEVKGEQ